MVAAKAAAVFVEEYGVLLELSGANAFRVRAYTNAVRALETLAAPLDEMLAAGTLTEVKGIGKSVAELVAEFAETGTARAYEELRTTVPAGLLEMLRVPGLGPRKIIAIREALGVADLDALAEAARAGQLADLKGFGKKTQENILKGIDYIRAHQGRFRSDIARAGTRPDERCALPGQRRAFVMRDRRIERQRQRAHFGSGSQPQIDAENIPLAGDFGQQAHGFASIALRRFTRLVALAAWQRRRIVEQDGVDVG